MINDIRSVSIVKREHNWPNHADMSVEVTEYDQLS